VEGQERLRAASAVVIGAGGLGHIGIQVLAALTPAEIVVVDRNPDAVKLALEIGAHHGVVADGDHVQEVLDLTGGHGADVILDIIGAGYLAKNLAALAFDGRITNIGLQQGRKAELDMGALMAKRGTIMSTTLRARPAAQKASIVAAVKENVWPLVDAGVLRPVIHCELPMAQADEAHRIMTASTHTGKILLLARPMTESAS